MVTARDEIRALFEAALELPNEQRGEFLRARCQDESVVREVESLLEHDSRAAEDFLVPASQPSRLDEVGFDAASCPQSHADPRGMETGLPPLNQFEGRTVGAYTIKRLIAEGGMGAVYLAQQASPRREVALKVMTAAYWSRSAQRRFEFETETLARLHHPNIAQVYESGIHRHENISPVPFFAMEYIQEARTVTSYCNEEALDLRQRLELYCIVCQAVHHGHQKGVIHRDLKPANILIDVNGHVKIIDFGIARSTDSDLAKTTMHTEAGQLLGTLAYMSPEQCVAGAGDIDTRADVYSLGVVLFELLTGRLPYDVSHMTIHAATRVICEQEPVRPSQIAVSGGVSPARLRGDLDTIIMKCLEKGRAKRYSSAAELTEDIQRYLRGEPISARPPSAWSSLLRWARLHARMTAALVTLFIASLVIGSSFATRHYLKSSPARIELTLRGSTFDPVENNAVREGDRAALFAASGDLLYEWLDELGGMMLAKLISLPEKWGGDKIVILAFNTSYRDVTLRGRLCAFSAGGPYDRPLWTAPKDQEVIESMPPDAWPRPKHDPGREYRSTGFQVTKTWLVDVFTGRDHPGPEIVAFHQHTGGSQGAICIWNLNGELLFRVWLDGGLGDVAWLPEKRILVCVAMKGDRDCIDYGWKTTRNHPSVVFAIRPQPGEITDGWIMPYAPAEHPRFEGDRWRGNWYRPLWYKIACPVEWTGISTYLLFFSPAYALGPEFSGGRHVQIRVLFQNRRRLLNDGSMYYFQFVIVADDSGEIVQRGLGGDANRLELQSNKHLPNPKDFELVDWTAFDPPCGPTTQPADLPGHDRLQG